MPCPGGSGGGDGGCKVLASLLALLVLVVSLVAPFCGGLAGLDTTGVAGGEVETGETDIGRLLNLMFPSLSGRQPTLHEANRSNANHPA